jgi:small subunit ribosomal protein S9
MAEETQVKQESADTAVAESTETKTTSYRPVDPPEGKRWWWGTGRRKKAIARVRIRPGDGKFIVNKKEIDAFFSEERDRNDIIAPLQAVDMVGSWDVYVNVKGGGFTGQAGAITLGLARAIADAVPDAESTLRHRGLLTRDARMKERKKPGQPGARKRFQFSKR